jgi:crossover junction endodeoxyribonuclease RuvC
MKILAIDPGVKGALAILVTDTNSLTIHDMPVFGVERNGKAKTEVNVNQLARLVATTIPDIAIVEKVGARPGQGVSSMFQFGRTVGMIEGVLAAANVPVVYVTPQEWKRVLKISAFKDESRRLATQTFPAYSDLFARAKDDGRAEAALIAHWFVKTAAHQSPVAVASSQ